VATPGAGEPHAAPGATPSDVLPGRRTNYRRWWNNPWSVVEAGGPREAGDWTPADAHRLRRLVKRARDAGLWIRFYTLNGTGPDEPSPGWDPSYNFGSRAAAALRWRAAIDAGVDFVATDQYEAFAALRRRGPAP
jgi:glycerophosphoryl diester phosphodiesterase